MRLEQIGPIRLEKKSYAMEEVKMNCKKIHEELVFRYADDEMEHELQIAFQRHVADCPHCARKARYTRRLLMIVRERTARCPAPNHLRERILAALPHRRDLLS